MTMTSQEMANLQKYYRSLKFKRKFTYDGSDLGVSCCETGTRFALWAPTAQSVTLLIYPDGDQSPCSRRIPMEKTEKGVWRYQESGSFHGTYYLYEIDHGFETVVTGDPYARACGINSRRCMAVDLKKTNPLGWAQDRAPAPQA